MIKKNIAIFASGEGSNAQSIIDYFRNSSEVKVVLIVTNNSKAGVVLKAKAEKTEVLNSDKKEYFASNLFLNELKSRNIDLIVLAGFLWMIPEPLIKTFHDKIINIHPALLPKFGGKGMYGTNVHRAVIHAKEIESGISIHYVNNKYDEGKIIAQFKCTLLENETPESLALKIKRMEHTFYPKVIEQLLSVKKIFI